MARRSRCRSKIFTDLRTRGRLMGSWRASRAGVVRSARRVASRKFMIGLLVGGRPGKLPSDDAAECQERPMAIALGEHLPDAGQRDAPGRLRWARGGAER